MRRERAKETAGASPSEKCNTIFMTEMDERAATCRGKIRGIFLEKDKEQMSGYIKDLERTLAINKEIISELLGKGAGESQNKRVIEKLNYENANLQFQLKKAIKERNDYQAKLLISEQIVEDYKAKELEVVKDNEEKFVELTDQLNRKEFFLQNTQRKYEKAEALLKRFSHKDQEIRKALKELNADGRAEKRITNVVEENEQLQKELAEKSDRVAALEQRVADLAEENVKLESLVDELKKKKGGDRAAIQAKITADTNPGETTDKGRIWMQEDDLEKMQNKMQNLYRLNVRLSEALELANQKLSSLKRPSQTAKRHNKSSIVCTAEVAHVVGISKVVEPLQAVAAQVLTVPRVEEEGNSFGEKRGPEEDPFSELSSINDDPGRDPPEDEDKNVVLDLEKEAPQE